MKRLIIINYQREVPPFMINDIKVASGVFDSVDYVTPELYRDNSDTVISENVTVLQCKRENTKIDKIKSVSMLLRKEILQEILYAIKEKHFKVSFIKHMCVHTYASAALLNNVCDLVNRYSNDNIVVLSAWYGVEAYILARVKEKFPFIKAVSFAHSFEIDTKKNKHVGFSLDRYKSCTIDNIVFISKKMQELYHNTTSNRLIKQEKESVRYLGSIKLYKELNPSLKNDTLRICSCSGAIPVKRIELIIEALEKWNGPKIHWTHLGGGPLLEELRAKSKEVKNDNVLVEFCGWMTNQEVQEYYTKHHFDLFVNVSASEGLPVSIMEACSYGIPCLATDVGGTSEIVKKNTGVLVAENITSDELRDSIYEFLSRDIKDIEVIRLNCVNVWNNEFNAMVNAQEFYSNIIK